MNWWVCFGCLPVLFSFLFDLIVWFDLIVFGSFRFTLVFLFELRVCCDCWF